MASAHLLYALSKAPPRGGGGDRVLDAVDGGAPWLAGKAMGLLEVRIGLRDQPCG
jgi:hypothetical protein